VISVYAAAAFVILELVSIITDPLRLPEWTLTFMIVLLCAGFLIAVVLSWIYDIHPDRGMVRTEPLASSVDSDKPAPSAGWRIATYISFAIIVVLIILHVIRSPGSSEAVEITEKSIAVLPFENMSDGSEFLHLGDALTDEIIMQLYKIKEFEVRSRTSVMKYKNSPKGSPELGQELNVNYLLEGSAQRYEDQVRIRVQLIQASTDNHIWGEVYQGAWEDVFDMQINMAKEIAGTLKAVLSPGEMEKIEEKPTNNMEAYNLYLRGRYLKLQGGVENLDKSIELLESAIELDPGFALAYAEMASAYNRYATSGIASRHDHMPLAQEAARKALELDDELAEAHHIVSWTRIIYKWEWREGVKGILRALELDPDNVYIRANYGFILSMMGRHTEAIDQYKKVRELDPMISSTWNGLARVYYNARDYDRALEEYEKMLERLPASEIRMQYYSLALAQSGRYEEAIAQFPACDQSNKSMYWMLGYIHGIAGNTEQAREILEVYLEHPDDKFVWSAGIAIIYAGMNDTENALDWLEKAVEQREFWTPLLKVDPMYDNLRADPRFQELLDRINFPED
jgi:serine/threonine-protein kinase